MAFADKLKELRLENHMTQKNVADSIQVARTTITGYETKGRQPSHEKLTALAGLFQVSLDYLLDEEDTIQLSLSQSDHLSSTEQNALSRYRKLTSRSKQSLLEYLHLLELLDAETRTR